MSLYRLLIVSFLVCIATHQSLASENTVSSRETITIAVHEYFPYYVDGVGLGVDIYRAAFATQNIDIKLVSFPIKRAIHKLINLEVDAFSPGTIFIVNKKTLEKIVYETSFFATIAWLHKPQNNPQNISNFEGMVLATEGTSLSYLEGYLDKGLKVVNIENTERRLKMMLHDRVTYAAVAGITGWHMLAKHNIKEFNDIEITTGRPFSCNLAFSIDNPRTNKLLFSFRKGMKTIKNNGTYLRILEDYWGIGNVPKDVLFDELKPFGTDHVDKNILFKTINKHDKN